MKPPTPGPYHVHEIRHGSPQLILVCDATGNEIASVCDARSDWPQDVANATLFAASRDLLDALEAFVAGWDDRLQAVFATVPDEVQALAPAGKIPTLGMIRAALAAIAKARGVQ